MPLTNDQLSQLVMNSDQNMQEAFRLIASMQDQIDSLKKENQELKIKLAVALNGE